MLPTAAIGLALAAAAPDPAGLPNHLLVDGAWATKYTRERVGYGLQREVYYARTVTLRDAAGREVAAEVRHGPAFALHPNGRVRALAHHRAGRPVGVVRLWAANGTLTDESPADGTGVYRQWAGDGRRIREETYAGGKPDGPARWWGTDGRPLCAGTHRAGAPWDGTFPRPAGAGAGVVVEEYKDGVKVGEGRRAVDWWW